MINWQDYEGRTALHLAVADGNAAVVKNLVSQKLFNFLYDPLHGIGSTQDYRKMIPRDCKSVDWEVKRQYILGIFLCFLFHLDLFIVIIFFKNKIPQGSEESLFGITRLAL